MISRQFIIYLIVGVLSAIVDIGTMQLALSFAASINLAVTLGYACGLTFNYLCHERITFKASTSPRTLVRYGICVLGNYLLTLVFVFAAVHWFDAAMAGKLASLPVVAVIGFLAGKYWIFK
jgi:putative flippase GtrA